MAAVSHDRFHCLRLRNLSDLDFGLLQGHSVSILMVHIYSPYYKFLSIYKSNHMFDVVTTIH